MKKTISILLAVLLLAGLGCGAFAAETPDDASEFSVENMIAANTWEAVTSRHDSLLIRTEYEDGEPSKVFLTKDYACDLVNGNLIDREDNWSYTDVRGEKVFAIDWYAMSEEERDALIWKPEYLFPVLNDDILLQEELADLTANEDGTLTLTLTLGAEEFAAIQESFGNPLPEEYAGMEYMSVFTLDADTLEILTSEELRIQLLRRNSFQFLHRFHQPFLLPEPVNSKEEFGSQNNLHLRQE